MRRLFHTTGFIMLWVMTISSSSQISDDDILSREYYCSEDLAQKNLECMDDSKPVLEKEHTIGYSKKQLDQTTPPCDLKKGQIDDAYYQRPSIEKNRIIFKRLEKEIAALKGHTTVELILQNRVVLNSPLGEMIPGTLKEHTNGWEVKMIKKTGGNEWKINWSHLQLMKYMVKELASLKGNGSKEFPDDIPLLRGKKFSPEHGLKVSGGWLLASDHGRYVGDLVFLDDDQKVKVLLNDTIKGLYKTQTGIIAITGQVYHEYYGYVVVKLIQEDKEWAIKEMIPLFSYPNFVEQKDDGSLIIDSYFGPFFIDESRLCRLNKPWNQ